MNAPAEGKPESLKQVYFGTGTAASTSEALRASFNGKNARYNSARFAKIPSAREEGTLSSDSDSAEKTNNLSSE